MDNQSQRQPKTIFEQIALGLEVTNANTVAIAQDLANLYKMVEDIHGALFVSVNSEPNASGAEQQNNQ